METIEQPVQEIKQGETLSEFNTFEPNSSKGETANSNYLQEEKFETDSNLSENEQENNIKTLNQAESLTAPLDGSIFGKFKDAKTLLDAYNSLQSEFTRKCQKLSQLQKLLGENASQDSETNLSNKTQNLSKNSENEQKSADFNAKNEKFAKTATDNLGEDNSKKECEINTDSSDGQKQTEKLVGSSSERIKSKFSKEGISADLFDDGSESETDASNVVQLQSIDSPACNSGDDSYKKGVVEMTCQMDKYLPKSSQSASGHEMALESIVAEKLNDQQFMDKYIFSNKTIKEKIISEYLSNLNKGSSVPSIMSGTSMGVMFSPSNGMPKTLKEAGELLSKMLK